MIAKLNEVSHKVDPYDAEETEVHLAQHCEKAICNSFLLYKADCSSASPPPFLMVYKLDSDSIRQINRWRRQIVKDNYNEMKKHQSSVQVRRLRFECKPAEMFDAC